MKVSWHYRLLYKKGPSYFWNITDIRHKRQPKRSGISELWHWDILLMIKPLGFDNISNPQNAGSKFDDLNHCFPICELKVEKAQFYTTWSIVYPLVTYGYSKNRKAEFEYCMFIQIIRDCWLFNFCDYLNTKEGNIWIKPNIEIWT